MARVQVSLAANDYQWLPDLFILNGIGDITTETATRFIYTNSVGNTVTVNGAGFTYAANKATGGTIGSVVVTNGAAQVLLTVDLLGDSLKDFVGRLLDGDSYAALEGLFDATNQLIGTEESDSLGGYSRGNDTVDAKGSDDFVSGDEGNDNLFGGGGWDTLSYQQTYWDKSATKGIKLNAAKGTVKDPWGDTDHFSGFEQYEGSKFSDKMDGSSGHDEFSGLKGNDIINGKGGWDLVDYSHDNKPVFPGNNGRGIKVDLAKGKIVDGSGDTDTVKNIEGVRGTANKDRFIGDNKHNDFQGIGGKDSYDGGKGFDFVNFSANDWKGGKHGVTVDAGKHKVLDDGYGNVEKFKQMEGFVGTKFADTFIGSNKDEQFKGEGGNDTMTGKGGADSFVFNPPPDNATNHDVITDFSGKDGDGDKIALNKIDGFQGLSSGGGDLNASEFVANAGGNATNAAQHVLYDTTNGNLYFDPTGNAVAGDRVLIATLTGAPKVVASDIDIWV